MTRGEAEAFLDLPDRSRVKTLRSMSPRERADALAVIVIALATPDTEVERAAA